MSGKQSIVEYLQRGHLGAENAIPGYKLCAALDMTAALMRQTVGELRAAGHPIASDRNGYFYAVRPEEIEETASHLATRIAEMTAAKEGLARAMADFTAPGDTE